MTHTALKTLQNQMGVLSQEDRLSHAKIQTNGIPTKAKERNSNRVGDLAVAPSNT